jgi:hypothetical protein
MLAASATMDTQHDERPIRCPMLGGQVTFKYCRTMAEGLPCRSIVPCWQEEFGIIEFLEANYTADELVRSVGSPRKSRLSRLLEAIDQAKKRQGQSGDDQA